MTLGDVLALGSAAVRRAGGFLVDALEQSWASVEPLLRRFWTGFPGLGPAAPHDGNGEEDAHRLGRGPAPGVEAAMRDRRSVHVAAPPGSAGLPRVPGPAGGDRPSVPSAPPPLPPSYGADHVGLLARDPYWLFAFWEVQPRTRVEALRALGAAAEGACSVLRVIEAAGMPAERPCFDVDLPSAADRWYVQVPRDGAPYAVEVGLRTLSGRFVRLGRSDVVVTPHARPSELVVVEWYTAPPPPPPEPTIVAAPPPPEPAPKPPPVPLPDRPAAGPEPPQRAVPAALEPGPAPGPRVAEVDTAALLAPDEPRSSEALVRR